MFSIRNSANFLLRTTYSGGFRYSPDEFTRTNNWKKGVMRCYQLVVEYNILFLVCFVEKKNEMRCFFGLSSKVVILLHSPMATQATMTTVKMIINVTSV